MNFKKTVSVMMALAMMTTTCAGLTTAEEEAEASSSSSPEIKTVLVHEDNSESKSEEGEQPRDPEPEKTPEGEGTEGGETEGGEGEEGGETEGGEPEDEGLIIDRKEQSQEIEADEGDPEKNPGTVMPEGYNVFINDDGVFCVTYTIKNDADADRLTIDLQQAMKHAHELGLVSNVEPGDTWEVQVFVQSESGHTYKYAEGSFVLTTPDLGTNQSTDADGNTTVNEPKEGDVVGFDGQVLDDKHITTGKLYIPISCTPIENLLIEQGLMTQDEADHNYKKSLTYQEYCKLKDYMNKTYGTDDVTEGLKKYLMEYYSEKDGKEYTDFESMVNSSAAAASDLVTGTDANNPIRYEGSEINNYVIANDLSSVPLTGLDCQTTLINEALGTSYDPPKSTQSFTNTQIARELAGTSSITLQQIIDMVNGKLEKKLTSAESKNLSTIKAALTSRKEEALAAAVYSTTNTSNESYRAVSYNRLYAAINKVDYRDVFIKKKGLDTLLVDKGSTGSLSGTVVSTVKNADALKRYIDANENLTDDEKTAIKAVIGTSSSISTSTWTPLFLKLYDVLHKDTGAYQDYLNKNGYDPDKVIIKDTSGKYTSSTTAISAQPDTPYSTATIRNSARYDTFYNKLLSVVYAKDKEGLEETTGGNNEIKYKLDNPTVYKIVDEDATFEVSPANEMRIVFDNEDIPKNVLTLKVGNQCFPMSWTEENEDGTKTVTYLTPENYQDYVSGEKISDPSGMNNYYIETENGCAWSYDDLAPQIGDYMDKDNQAWQDADSLFKEIFGQGINKDTTTPVEAFIGYNLDGPLTGNYYQLTEWGWHNTIDLERQDGEVTLNKVDEDGNALDGAEFSIWRYEDSDNDGQYTEADDKYFLTSNEVEQEDGSKKTVYSFVKYNEAADSMSLTVKVPDGQTTIDFAMLKDTIYYMQEVVAPDGYEGDSTIYIICDNDEAYENAKNMLNDANVDFDETAGEDGGFTYAGAIDTQNGLTIKVVNARTTVPNNPPDNPPPTPDEPPFTIGDYGIPLSGSINMNEGDCFD